MKNTREVKLLVIERRRTAHVHSGDVEPPRDFAHRHSANVINDNRNQAQRLDDRRFAGIIAPDYDRQRTKRNLMLAKTLEVLQSQSGEHADSL
jgi:hypothetical protein